MRLLLVTVITLSCTAAHAQVYKCPAVHPTESGLQLTHAQMHIGELHGSGALHGDIEEVKGGTDTHYNFPEHTPRWLVCEYGGKRTSGTAITSAQVIGGRQFWMPLDPLIDVCDLQTRESKPRDRSNSTWAATATCKGKELPPPVMLP